MASRPGRGWRSRDGGRAGADGGGKPTAAQYVPEDKLKEVQRVLYGCNMGQPVPAIPTAEGAAALGAKYGFKTQTYKFSAAKEQLRPPRVVKVALLQSEIVLPTTDPFAHQKEAIHALVGKMIEAAAADGANIVCLQEAWNMPFAFATREKHWAEFAEDAYTGPATLMLSEYAKRFDMVIVSPILERDNKHLGQLWNTAVVIGHSGNVVGISRKNHIPRVGDFNESTYYMEGNTGHPVFHTKYGKDRHQHLLRPAPDAPDRARRGRLDGGGGSRAGGGLSWRRGASCRRWRGRRRRSGRPCSGGSGAR